MIRAWYMAPSDLCVPNTGEPIVVGGTVEVAGPVVPCKHGLHASRHVLDAIAYRSTGCLTVVDIDGDVHEGDYKIAGLRRTTVAVLSPERTDRLLRLIACACAEMAIGWSGEPPDRRSVDAIDTARRYADGIATPEELAATRSAAWSATRAARSAAWAASDAAWAAAWAAASDAASDAAWAAAWAAACDAAWVARYAARSAAWVARYAARSAAWVASDAAWVASDAAWAAASDAAWDALHHVADRMALEEVRR
jgi:hypothetical protein